MDASIITRLNSGISLKEELNAIEGYTGNA
jgi:hypothetical protein